MPHRSGESRLIPCPSGRVDPGRVWRPVNPSRTRRSVTLPTTPIPDVSSTGGTLYITVVVNPTKTVTESNYHNDEDLGPPYDTAPS